jgi:hypothetical protein
MNEPELGAGIDPGMAFNPFPYSIWIRRDSNPQFLDCESSSLTIRPDLRPKSFFFPVFLDNTRTEIRNNNKRIVNRK